jgi:hypothetical protein
MNRVGSKWVSSLSERSRASLIVRDDITITSYRSYLQLVKVMAAGSNHYCPLTSHWRDSRDIVKAAHKYSRVEIPGCSKRQVLSV